MGVWTINGGSIFDLNQEKFVPNIQKNIMVHGEDERVIDLAEDALIIPGFVDAHVHAWERDAAKIYGLPWETFIATGIVAAADCGSHGYVNSERAHLIWDHAPVEMRSWMFMIPEGCVVEPRPKRLAKDCSLDQMVETFMKAQGKILGFKAILGYLDYASDEQWLKLVREAADRTKSKIMVHLTGCCLPVDEVLDYMRPGDIICHPYQGYLNASTVYDSGEVSPKLVDAYRNKGIVFDSGLARRHFTFDVYRKCHAIGLEPTYISSDMVLRDWHESPLWNFPHCVSKFIAAGMDRDLAFKAAVTNPAKLLNVELDYGENMLILDKHSETTLYTDTNYDYAESFWANISYVPKIFVFKQKLAFDHEVK